MDGSVSDSSCGYLFLCYRTVIAYTGLSVYVHCENRELLLGESLNTTASDVFAFGILLYEAYSRKEPYENEREDIITTLALVASPQLNKRPPIDPKWPPQVRSIMAECFASRPALRPSFEEIDRRLKRVEIKTADDGMGDVTSKSNELPKVYLAENPKTKKRAPKKDAKAEVSTIDSTTEEASDDVQELGASSKARQDFDA